MRVFRQAIGFILIAAVGIFMLVMTIRDKIELSKPPADIATIKESELRSGMFVEGDIYEVWNEFATLEESDSAFGIEYNKRTSAHYYAIPLESSFGTDVPKFLAIAVKTTSDINTAKKMAQESLDYYNDENAELTTVMHVKGKVSKLKKKAAEYFDDYMTAEGFTPSTVSLHYVINVGNDGKGINVMLAISIGATLLGVLGTAIVFIRGGRRGW